MLHARVPYDTESARRLMWRMEFERDPADKTAVRLSLQRPRKIVQPCVQLAAQSAFHAGTDAGEALRELFHHFVQL